VCAVLLYNGLLVKAHETCILQHAGSQVREKASVIYDSHVA
jgi:hypothetical protein